MAETAYIDKYKVYEEACAGCWYHGDEVGSCNLSEPCEKLVRAFASAPAADVVAVVQCKNCKWFADNNGGEWYGCKMFQVVRITPEDAPQPDDFCSCGEAE